MVLAAAVLIRRIRARQASLAAGILALLPTALSATELDGDGNWTVKHAGRPVRIAQCGFNVTVFALEYFRVGYDVKAVSVNLPPTGQGIRLSDIRDVLEGQGLEVIARKGVQLNDLKRVIQPDTIAIVPVSVKNGPNHYVLAIDDPRQGVLVIDPPVREYSLGDLPEQRVSDLGGVVLFVRQPASQSQLGDRVTASPATIDYGTFRYGDPQSSTGIKRSFRLTNKSQNAALITGTGTPCGCARVDWTGGLIRAGESQEVTVTVIPGGWPTGNTQRVLPFMFPDGSQVQVTLRAECLTAEAVQGISVKQKTVEIILTPDVSPGSILERKVSVKHPPGASERLKVMADSPWLSAKLVPTGGTESTLAIKVEIPPKLDGTALAGDVLLASQNDGDPVRVRVWAPRQPRYIVSPPVLRFAADGPAAQNVTLKRVFGDLPLPETVGCVSALPGVNVTKVSADADSVTFAVTCPRGSAAGLHGVGLQPHPDRPIEPVVNFLLQVGS